MSEPELRWWVASFADQDTHLRAYSPVTRNIHTGSFNPRGPHCRGFHPIPCKSVRSVRTHLKAP
jgi:hypothetical protein